MDMLAGFQIPDGIELEPDQTIGMVVEYSHATGKWSMHINEPAKLPKIRNVADQTDGSSAKNVTWFVSFTSPAGIRHDAPMLTLGNGTISETRNDLTACAAILGFDIKNDGGHTMSTVAKCKRIAKNGWTYETAQNFQS